MSSILPARGRHQLNNSIAPSNRNMSSACTKLNVDMIDNAKSFVTQNGAPRQALYRPKDAIHPSARGTACLALNFKRFLPQNKPHSVDSHDHRDSLRHPQHVNHSSYSLRSQDSNFRKISSPQLRVDPGQTGYRNLQNPPPCSVEEFPSLHRVTRPHRANMLGSLGQSWPLDSRPTEFLENTKSMEETTQQGNNSHFSEHCRYLSLLPSIFTVPSLQIHTQHVFPTLPHPMLYLPYPMMYLAEIIYHSSRSHIPQIMFH